MTYLLPAGILVLITIAHHMTHACIAPADVGIDFSYLDHVINAFLVQFTLMPEQTLCQTFSNFRSLLYHAAIINKNSEADSIPGATTGCLPVLLMNMRNFFAFRLDTWLPITRFGPANKTNTFKK